MTVQGVSKSQTAYQYLLKLLSDGTLRPGQRIVVDQIVSELGLSQSPIREAIRKLESEGYLLNKPYCGVVVASMELKECFERMHVLGILDSSAAGLSAPFLCAAEMDELTQINEAMQTCIHSEHYVHAGKLDRQFHDLLNSRCKNSYLLQSIQDQWTVLQTIRELNVMFYPSRLMESVKEHVIMISLIKERKFDEIERFVHIHMMNSIKAYSNALNQ